MTDIHNVEYALDCEGGDRRIFFLLRGGALRVTILELRGPKESGPDWSGASGELDRFNCEMAVEDLHEWIATRDPKFKGSHHMTLTLDVSSCLYAWRNTGDTTINYRQKIDLEKVVVHVESLNDANYLERQFQDFMRLLRR